MTNFFIHASSLKYLINSLDTKIFISYRNENSSISKVKKLVMGISQTSVFGALTPISSSSILILLLTTNKLKKCLSIIPLSIKQCHRVVLIFTLSPTNTYFGLNITFIFSADGSDNSGNCSCNSCNDFVKGFQFGIAAEYDYSDEMLKLSLLLEIVVPVMSRISTLEFKAASCRNLSSA